MTSLETNSNAQNIGMTYPVAYGGIATCSYCGCWHAGWCPQIQEIEFYPNGTVRRIRFRDYAPTAQVNVTWGLGNRIAY